MSDLISILANKTGFISTGSVSDAEIHKAEETLSVQFAEDYKKYLAAYGCASFKGHELTGLYKSNRLNVVDATLRSRDLFSNIPIDWYVVEETNIDNIIIWQNSKGFVFKALPGIEPIKIAQDLVEYLSEDDL